MNLSLNELTESIETDTESLCKNIFAYLNFLQGLKADYTPLSGL